jgi:hypothetical protein
MAVCRKEEQAFEEEYVRRMNALAMNKNEAEMSKKTLAQSSASAFTLLE